MLELLYLDDGIYFGTYVDSLNTVIDGRLEFSNVSFFVPTKEAFEKEISIYNFEDDFVIWQGVHDFKFYCQDNHDDFDYKGAICQN